MLRSTRLGTAISVLAALLVTTGCFERKAARLQPRLGFVQDVRLDVGGYRNVDLVLVIDNSGSMKEEQDILEERIADLVHDLTAPPDDDGDGRPDWGAVERLRIAIVSTDMGTSGVTLPPRLLDRCEGFGDDGQYRTDAACAGAQPGLQVYEPGDDATAFSARIGCIVDSLDITGCPVEQQLEAGARAVERGTDLGGFPAPDAILAVLVLTDEEDCSMADPEAFYAAFAADPARANMLCQDAAQGANGADPAWLRSIDSLVTRLSAGRSDDSFVFAAITGLPTSLSGHNAAEVLAHSDMQYREIADEQGRRFPRPACQVENGDAAPARRIVELAGRFEGSVLHSICEDDFGPAIARLTDAIVARTGSVCLARRIPIIGDGIQCQVRFTLPAGSTCEASRGQREVQRTADGEPVCEVRQVAAGGGGEEGYFYEDSAECPRLVFTEGAEPPLGTRVQASCYFEIGPDGSVPSAADAGASATGP